MLEIMQSLQCVEWPYWSCGRHHEFGFDARVWRIEVDPVTNKRRIPHVLGIGRTLEEAVAHLQRKLAERAK